MDTAQPQKLSNARQLDWKRASKAAEAIIKQCSDAGYVAPEDLAVLRLLIKNVCASLNDISAALLIRLPVSDVPRGDENACGAFIQGLVPATCALRQGHEGDHERGGSDGMYP